METWERDSEGNLTKPYFFTLLGLRGPTIIEQVTVVVRCRKFF